MTSSGCRETSCPSGCGPFVEAKKVLGGCWLVEADSKEQLVRLMKKCPAEDGDVIEIRQVFSPEDFAVTQ